MGAQREEPVREADPLYEPLFIPGFGQTRSQQHALKMSEITMPEGVLDEVTLRSTSACMRRIRSPEDNPCVPLNIVNNTTQCVFNFRMIKLIPVSQRISGGPSTTNEVQPLNGEEFLSMRFEYREKERLKRVRLFYIEEPMDKRYKSYNAMDYVSGHCQANCTNGKPGAYDVKGKCNKCGATWIPKWRLAAVNEAAWERLDAEDRIEVMEVYRRTLTENNMHISSRNEQERLIRKEMRSDLDNKLESMTCEDLEEMVRRPYSSLIQGSSQVRKTRGGEPLTEAQKEEVIAWIREGKRFNTRRFR